MESKSHIDACREVIQNLKAKGATTISIDGSLEYLDALKADSGTNPDIVLAEFRATHDSQLAHYRAVIDSALDQVRAANAAGQTALRTALLTNGGAAVAMLAFIGSIWSSDVSPTPDSLGCLPWGLLSFVTGVSVAAIATGTSYLALFTGNKGKTDHDKRENFNKWNKRTIGLAALSHLLFLAGGVTSFCWMIGCR